jgi:hypothetical protein
MILWFRIQKKEQKGKAGQWDERGGSYAILSTAPIQSIILFTRIPSSAVEANDMPNLGGGFLYNFEPTTNIIFFHSK